MVELIVWNWKWCVTYSLWTFSWIYWNWIWLARNWVGMWSGSE